MQTLKGARSHNAAHLPKIVKTHPHGRGAIRWSEHSLVQIGGECTAILPLCALGSESLVCAATRTETWM